MNYIFKQKFGQQNKKGDANLQNLRKTCDNRISKYMNHLNIHLFTFIFFEFD
jgi:hypothetical protein